MEEWRPVKGYEDQYIVSNRGRVISKGGFITRPNGLVVRYPTKILKQSLAKTGYYVVGLTKDKKCNIVSVHLLVAEAFIGERKKGMVINHLDGIKTNNNSDNIELTTYSGNILHAYETGLRKKKKSAKPYMVYVAHHILTGLERQFVGREEIAKFLEVSVSHVTNSIRLKKSIKGCIVTKKLLKECSE